MKRRLITTPAIGAIGAIGAAAVLHHLFGSRFLSAESLESLIAPTVPDTSTLILAFVFMVLRLSLILFGPGIVIASMVALFWKSPQPPVSQER